MLHYFERRPGDPTARSVDDPTMLLVGDLSPGNTIRVLSELGGGTAKIDSVSREPCPHPDCKHFAPFYWLDFKDLVVVECATQGFLWCAAKPNSENSNRPVDNRYKGGDNSEP